VSVNGDLLRALLPFNGRCTALAIGLSVGEDADDPFLTLVGVMHVHESDADLVCRWTDGACLVLNADNVDGVAWLSDFWAAITLANGSAVMLSPAERIDERP
jgi:hypothetical protein